MTSGVDDPAGESSRLSSIQPSLFRERIGTVYPTNCLGKDYSFMCEAAGGGIFHCKNDRNGKAVRSNEFICQSIVQHLGIPVPEFRVMEDEDGETYFASRQAISTADPFHLQSFMNSSQTNELGQRSDWLGRHLAMVYVVDLFLGNPDRTTANFVLEHEGTVQRLCVIDFADAQLNDLSSDRFPIAATNTLRHGRWVRNAHGFFADSALEMAERIRAVPREFLVGILMGMPDDWLGDDQERMLIDLWSNGAREARLSALRAGIINGSLL